jgi:broad-specificity NMP kinase
VSRHSQSFVAEIIGPAGAGKTSLTSLLRQNKNVRAGLSLWGLSLASIARGVVSSGPILFAFCRERKYFGWDDVKLIIQHNALLHLVRLESSKGYQAVLLDEGTVFALAKLQAFGPGDEAPAESNSWMRSLFNKLAPTLDAVVWLDAPDAVLAQRIREREKPHRIKNGSDSDIQNHVKLYRNSFERVVSELSRRNGLKVYRFSTDQEPMEAIAQKVLSYARGA